MVTIPDYDMMRHSGAVPHYFGLGFIQVKLNDTERMHFWHPDLSATVPAEEAHSHRYALHSTILVGAQYHQMFTFYSSAECSATHEMSYTDCQPGNKFEEVFLGKLQQDASLKFVAGSDYILERDTLHSVRADAAVSFVNRVTPPRDRAKVVREIGAATVCPFETTIPKDHLWGMIKELYGDFDPASLQASAALPKKPGYHLANILKGELGEPSKLLEEVQEIIDARKQGVKLMELVEMADLYGAMQALLAKHHPDYDMSDLARMAAVTERAFVNGRR